MGQIKSAFDFKQIQSQISFFFIKGHILKCIGGSLNNKHWHKTLLLFEKPIDFVITYMINVFMQGTVYS